MHFENLVLSLEVTTQESLENAAQCKEVDVSRVSKASAVRTYAMSAEAMQSKIK